MSLPTCKIHGISYGARFSECPICVREERDRLRVGDAEMLNAIDDWRLRAGVAESEVKRLLIIIKGLEQDTADKMMWREEAQRLREIIRKEGEKWAAHHADIDKKKYWAAFAMKAGGSADR